MESYREKETDLVSLKLGFTPMEFLNLQHTLAELIPQILPEQGTLSLEEIGRQAELLRVYAKPS